MPLPLSHPSPRFPLRVFTLLCSAYFLGACASHNEPKAETPVPRILTSEMNRQRDPVKTERFVERVGQQSSYIAEPALAAGLAHINSLPPTEQNTESAYIRSWQALRYFNLVLDAGFHLQPNTPWTVLETLQKSTWASVRQQSVHVLARITGYQPEDPLPDPYLEADQSGGPRPGSLKNLNEPVRNHPFGLITPVRQTCCESDYYSRLAQTYLQIMTEQSKSYDKSLKTQPRQPAATICPRTGP
jgi:hypothetical protein